MDRAKLEPDQTLEVAVPPNLLNEFNNKPLRLEEGLEDIYRRLFGLEYPDPL